MMTKQQIRAFIRDTRNQLTYSQIESASKQVTNQIIRQEQFKLASTIFLYAAFNTEIQTKYLHAFAKDEGKMIAYPKVHSDTGEMTFYGAQHIEELQIQNFKSMQIYEPNPLIHTQVIPDINDLIITPGLAFDKQGNRIGYGGGFYDRYLTKYSSLYKIGVCMDFQLFNQIPADRFDVKVDCIFTQTQYYLPV